MPEPLKPLLSGAGAIIVIAILIPLHKEGYLAVIGIIALIAGLLTALGFLWYELWGKDKKRSKKI